jgi:mono/diheme cytochrome c family protein
MRVAVLAVLLSLGGAGAAWGADVAAGRALFQAHCSKCHAEGGTGAFMLGRRLGKEKALLEDRRDLDPAYVRHVVRHGVVHAGRAQRPGPRRHRRLLDADGPALSRACGKRSQSLSSLQFFLNYYCNVYPVFPFTLTFKLKSRPPATM